MPSRREKMQRTRIEWVRNPDGNQGLSWNPIKGVCPKKCRLPDGRIYCYGKRFYDRYGWDPNLRLDEKELQKPLRRIKPSGFFISMMEIFHSKISFRWRQFIFKIIENCPQHRFYILTKCPENIDRPMPDNVWLGVSVTTKYDFNLRVPIIDEINAKIKFISFEPLLKKIPLQYTYLYGIDWIIIGRLTGFGKKYDPKLTWIEHIKYCADVHNIPVFLKDNLKYIWREGLIQEFPRVK
jgi:protein gp37